MRKLALIGSCLVVASFLVACGGGESEEDEIVDVVETSVSSTDPASCVELATQSFIEQTTAEAGGAAVKACEKNVKEGEGAESADVSNVAVDGTDASADAAMTGGPFDGQTLAVALVEEGDQWKLDEVTEFATFDRAKFVETVEEQLGETNEIDEAIVACIGDALADTSQGEVEELFLSGSSDAFVELVEDCSE